MRLSRASLLALVGLCSCSAGGQASDPQTDTGTSLSSGSKGHKHGTGGAAGLGGSTSTGGTMNMGGTGGAMAMGGTTSTGGTSMVMGGTTSTGGTSMVMGGTTSTGGTSTVMGGTGGSTGMTMPMTCGDGVCQVAMEDMRNCPADCANLVYPAGSPGSSTFDVAPTTELPVPDGIGAFRTVCQFSHMSIDDPLVYPGQPGLGHLHTFFGNTGTNAYSTHDSLRASGNSTCRGGIANRSAYWIPTLIGPNGPIAPGNSNFYYKSGYDLTNSASQMHLIPSGLKMIAGDHTATGPTQSGAVSSWGCLNNYVGHNQQIVDCPVGDYIQLSVIFPQCWNGVDLDSPDHKSHMAYPVNGECPSDHPVAIPVISVNAEWLRTADMDVTQLRLSSDDYDPSLPGGYSGHSDYMEAWDPTIRDTFVIHCDQASVDCHSHLLGDGRMITSSF